MQGDVKKTLYKYFFNVRHPRWHVDVSIYFIQSVRYDPTSRLTHILSAISFGFNTLLKLHIHTIFNFLIVIYVCIVLINAKGAISHL
jgi:hypothetical protein